MKTSATQKALRILNDHKDGISANHFAKLLWGEDPDKQVLFSATTNTGNGACSGKKAWLCAGSFLGKLRKKELVVCRYENGWAYFITSKGRKLLN